VEKPLSEFLNLRFRASRRDFLRGRVVAQDHRIDIALANAPRDDLCVLRTKIKDDYLLIHAK